MYKNYNGTGSYYVVASHLLKDVVYMYFKQNNNQYFNNNC